MGMSAPVERSALDHDLEYFLRPMSGNGLGRGVKLQATYMER